MRPRRLLHFLQGRGARRKAIRKAGCFLIPIPRTSTTSISAELMARHGVIFGKEDTVPLGTPRQDYLPAHLTAIEARSLLGPVWSDIYKFSVVRNPWDRNLSLYRHRVKAGNFKISFLDYLLALEQRDKRYFRHAFLWQQCADFLTDKGEIIVDDVLRFENRAENMKKLSDRLGIPLGEEHLYATEGEPFEHSYTSEGWDIIARVAHRDIELFGYH